MATNASFQLRPSPPYFGVQLLLADASVHELTRRLQDHHVRHVSLPIRLVHALDRRFDLRANLLV